MKLDFTILMNAPVAMAILEGENYEVKWSNNAYEILGGERRRGKSFFDQWPELDIAEVRTLFFQSKNHPHALRCAETPVGQSYLSVKVQSIADEKLWVVIDDVTEWVKRIKTAEVENRLQQEQHREQTRTLTNRETSTLEAFKQREETFRLLIENSKDGISLTDKDGLNIYISPAAENILGYSESEMAGSHGFKHIHPEDQTRIPDIFSDFSPGKSITYEMRVGHKNGTYRWIEVTSTNLLHVAGIESVVSNFRDVTERKNHELEAGRRTRELQQLANAMPQLVWIADADGRVTYYNERIAEYAGAEKKGDQWEWSPLVHPDDTQKTIDAWNNSIATKSTYSLEHRVKMRDGSYRYHLSRAYPHFDESGEVAKWFGTATDIAEQKEAQLLLEQYASELARQVNARTAELTQQIAFTQKVLDSAIDVMAVYDSSYRLMIANRRYYEKFNFKPDDVWGKTYLEIFPEEKLAFERIVKGFEGHELFFPSHKSKYSDRYFETYIVPLKDVNEKVYSVLVIAHDVTQSILDAEQLRTANESLLKQNEELEQFAYIASHDLQEPLRKIMTFARLIESADPEHDDWSRYLQKIIQSSNRMSELIRDVLKFSQLNRAESFQPVDLNMVLDNILTDLELLISQKGAAISFGQLPVLDAVPRQMSQLFYNLISNGLKFSRAGVPVKIQITCAKISGLSPEDEPTPYYKLTFRDNGIGFNQTYADKIFMMFQRLNTREQFSGSGIGLAMVKKIVSNHHGYVLAEGQEEKGATFHVILPEKQPEEHS